MLDSCYGWVRSPRFNVLSPGFSTMRSRALVVRFPENMAGKTEVLLQDILIRVEEDAKEVRVWAWLPDSLSDMLDNSRHAVYLYDAAVGADRAIAHLVQRIQELLLGTQTIN